jgi:hypothetical protein
MRIRRDGPSLKTLRAPARQAASQQLVKDILAEADAERARLAAAG